MPAATTTKPAMAGTKRKSAPVKNVHVKESKKPKFDSDMKSALKTKTKPLPVKGEEPSDEDFEDSDSDGGVPVNFESNELDDVEEDGEVEAEETDSEEVPKTTDGLHPERAKAVVTNSKSSQSP
jgi:pumilio family protein 6